MGGTQKMNEVIVKNGDRKKYFNMLLDVVKNFDKKYLSEYDINSDLLDDLLMSVDVNNNCLTGGLFEQFNNKLLAEYMRLFQKENPDIIVIDNDIGNTDEYEENQDFYGFEYDVGDLIFEDVKSWFKNNLET